jgi:hypothetical protein
LAKPNEKLSAWFEGIFREARDKVQAKRLAEEKGPGEVPPNSNNAEEPASEQPSVREIKKANASRSQPAPSESGSGEASVQ